MWENHSENFSIFPVKSFFRVSVRIWVETWVAYCQVCCKLEKTQSSLATYSYSRALTLAKLNLWIISFAEQRDQRATTPSGSHRVLLKLKKMSNRPKSMHENDQQNPSSENNVPSTTTKSKLPSSKSMHQFYNRTWNERSLTKYAGQHNYENVYSNNYDDYFASDNCDGCVINQLTCSPRSGRRSNFDNFAPPQPDYSVPPVPPERKGRGRKRAEKPLFRSKSCERPKMRDTFRVGSERFAANFNRISSNITDKILHFQQENPEISSREISTVSNNSILQSVALRAIPCVDIQVGLSYYLWRPEGIKSLAIVAKITRSENLLKNCGGKFSVWFCLGIDLWNEWDPIIFHFSKQMMTLSAIRTIHPLKFPLLMWQQKHCIDIEAAWLPEVDFIALSSLLLQALFSCSDRCKVVGNGLHLSIPSRII